MSHRMRKRFRPKLDDSEEALLSQVQERRRALARAELSNQFRQASLNMFQRAAQRKLPDRAEHPVQYALMRGYTACARGLAEELAKEQVDWTRYFAFLQGWGRFAGYVLQDEPRKRLSRGDIRKLKEWCEEWGEEFAALLVDKGGFSYAEAKAYVGRDKEALLWRPKGAPRSARSVAVSALELRMKRGLSWSELTNEVCTCGSKKHGRECVDRLRQNVRALKKLLDRHPSLNRRPAQSKQ